MRIKILFIGWLTVALAGCAGPEQTPQLKPGIWRGELSIQNQQLPFNFELAREGQTFKVYLHNAEERLLLDEINVVGDTVTMAMHIFDADIKAKIEGNRLSGYWKKNYVEDYEIPFQAQPDTPYRFAGEHTNPDAFVGRWGVTLVHEGDTAQTVAIFDREGNQVVGTFLTPTGDYRYLEGGVIEGKLRLSTFDGGHAFLFVAEAGEGGTLRGDFWSGKSWHETWTAVRDENASLPSANELTYLKKGYDRIDFRFPDLQGDTLSPFHPRFADKALILQIFGTWCPNCMDETKFLSQWYKDNKERDVEILGLAYEVKDDYAYARARILKMKEKLGIDYDFVVAGVSNKEKASRTLPMLNRIMAFPTTIYLDRDKNVVKIHTGFTGPGTGPYYEQFVKEFNATVDEMLGDEAVVVK